ncbi:hypothetical protein J6590_051259 [Homalodisca vitripennis]|nr:hypothetical protein J6590_051259 [Homalodisca vitripennis]
MYGDRSKRSTTYSGGLQELCARLSVDSLLFLRTYRAAVTHICLSDCAKAGAGIPCRISLQGPAYISHCTDHVPLSPVFPAPRLQDAGPAGRPQLLRSPALPRPLIATRYLRCISENRSRSACRALSHISIRFPSLTHESTNFSSR